MGTLIQLPRRKPSADKAKQPFAGCHIMIFPGVRIERELPPADDRRDAKTRRKRYRKTSQSG
jgi:hypothetical protein